MCIRRPAAGEEGNFRPMSLLYILLKIFQKYSQVCPFFYVSGVTLKYVKELHGPFLLIFELVANYVGFVLDQAWTQCWWTLRLLLPLRRRPLLRHPSLAPCSPSARSPPLRGHWRQVGYFVVFSSWFLSLKNVLCVYSDAEARLWVILFAFIFLSIVFEKSFVRSGF